MFSMPLMFFKVFGVQIARELYYRGWGGGGERGGESERESVCVCVGEKHMERDRKRVANRLDRNLTGCQTDSQADRQFVK